MERPGDRAPGGLVCERQCPGSGLRLGAVIDEMQRPVALELGPTCAELLIGADAGDRGESTGRAAIQIAVAVGDSVTGIWSLNRLN